MENSALIENEHDFDLESYLIKIIVVVAEAAGVVAQSAAATAALYASQPTSGTRRSISNMGLVYLRTKIESNPNEFRKVYRMYPDCFMKLCQILRGRGYLNDTKHISVEEMLATFMLTVGQNQRYSITGERFDRSRWTISVSFNRALNALVELSPYMMVSPSSTTPEKVMSDPRYYPYFKDCVGAIDGTHIPAMVTGDDIERYRNRHGNYSQNVLAACTFDLQFIYVLAGWEGSANDAKVLKDAMSRLNGLPPPHGKFYLVDCGYPNRLQFLAPYRGTRYHLKEFGHSNNRQRPRNSKEVFNLRHASLRNCIERIFGIFKSRFTIFKSQPPGFPYETQKRMVWACVGLHNYLCKENQNDEFTPDSELEEAPRNIPSLDEDSDAEDDLQTQSIQRAAAATWRDNLANQMWEDATHVTTGQ